MIEKGYIGSQCAHFSPRGIYLYRYPWGTPSPEDPDHTHTRTPPVKALQVTGTQHPHAWHKIAGETYAQYDAFLKYRNLALDERRVVTIAEKTNFTVNYIQKLRKRWNWDTRAIAYDVWLLDHADEELIRRMISFRSKASTIIDDTLRDIRDITSITNRTLALQRLVLSARVVYGIPLPERGDDPIDPDSQRENISKVIRPDKPDEGVV